MQTTRHGNVVTALVEASEERRAKLMSKSLYASGCLRTYIVHRVASGWVGGWVGGWWVRARGCDVSETVSECESEDVHRAQQRMSHACMGHNIGLQAPTSMRR